MLVARLNKMKLDNKLDLLEHSAFNKLVNLPHRHVFNNFEGFCHTVANTTNGSQILHTLIKFMNMMSAWQDNMQNKKTQKLKS